MTFEIDDILVAALGFGDLPSDARERLRQWMYQTLEERVGEALTDGLTDQQLTEFEALIDAGQEDASAEWLAVNRPDYQAVTLHLFDRVKRDVCLMRSGIKTTLLAETGEMD